MAFGGSRLVERTPTGRGALTLQVLVTPEFEPRCERPVTLSGGAWGTLSGIQPGWATVVVFSMLSPAETRVHRRLEFQPGRIVTLTLP